VKIRYRIFGIVSVFIIIMSGIFMSVYYNNYKKILMKTVDEKLYMAAVIAHAGVNSPGSDRLADKTTALKERLEKISDQYSHFNKELGTDHLWSLLEYDGKIFFSSSGEIKNHSEKKRNCFELLTYSDAYKNAFLTMAPQYHDIIDSEERFRSIYIPYSGRAGKRYIVGACLKLHGLESQLYKKMTGLFIVIPFLFLFGIPVTAIILRQFAKPLSSLNEELERIAVTCESSMVETTGLYEYSCLSENVNIMINTCHEKIRSLIVSKGNLDIERQQLFSIFQGIDEDIYIVDPATLKILFINRPIGAQSPASLVGKTCYREIYGFDSQCEFCTNDIILKKKPDPHRWDYHDPHRQKYFAMIDRAIKWPDGRDVSFHFAIDITERKLSEEKIQNLLKRSQKQAQELAARQKQLRLVNEGLEIQTEALIQSEEDLKARQEELAHTNRVLSEQSSQLEEQKRHLNDKNVALEKAKKEVEQKAVELENTSRYKSDFLANMSHELRTPLNSILLLSRYLAEDSKGSLSNKQKECAETVYSSGNELLSLINEVLDLARVESGNMILELVETNIWEIVDDLEKKFRPVAEDKGLGFNLHVDEALPECINTDPLRLGQVLRNLLSNAFKFTEKGSVSFDVSCRDSDLPVVFTVKDTGEGIDKDKQDIVFQAFKQADGSTSRKYGGTGLGLSISREYATALQGELSLLSTVGLGSVFALGIPYDITETESQEIQHLQSTVNKNEQVEIIEKESDRSDALSDTFQIVTDDRDSISTDNVSILIIETNPEYARKIRDIVWQEGYFALVADTGEAGLFLTEAYSPVGIILNMNLAVMTGKTVLFRLKDNLATRHIPVCAIPDEGRLLEPMRMGAMGCLDRNADSADIKSSINAIDRALSTNLKKVLIIEDVPPSQQMISALIKTKAVETIIASTAQEARTKLNKDVFDCIILDLGLPDASGIDFLVELRKTYSNYLPVIVFTALELSPEQRSALDNYANSIVIKGQKSKEKLLDSTAMCLHLPIDSLPETHKKLITKLYDREAILVGKKVLIADDDMRNVFSLISVLEDKGIEIVVAKTGKDALTELAKNPDTDIVLMDIMMPEMDGYEAIQAIREMAGDAGKVPVIALTARAMKGDRARCIEVGANDYISKPVEADKLISMLRIWLY